MAAIKWLVLLAAVVLVFVVWRRKAAADELERKRDKPKPAPAPRETRINVVIQAGESPQAAEPVRSSGPEPRREAVTSRTAPSKPTSTPTRGSSYGFTAGSSRSSSGGGGRATGVSFGGTGGGGGHGIGTTNRDPRAANQAFQKALAARGGAPRGAFATVGDAQLLP